MTTEEWTHTVSAELLFNAALNGNDLSKQKTVGRGEFETHTIEVEGSVDKTTINEIVE